jgi:hypothetical protein
MSKGAREVISIEEDAKVPDIYGLERFMEEVNILELEGYTSAPTRTRSVIPTNVRSRLATWLESLLPLPLVLTVDLVSWPISFCRLPSLS